MSLELFNSTTDGSQGTRITDLGDGVSRAKLNGSADNNNHWIEVTGNLDGGDATIKFGNDGATFTGTTTAAPLGGAPILIYGQYIEVNGSGLGAASILTITLY